VRRRLKRDFIVLAGIAAVLAAIVLYNYNLQRGELWEKFESMRMEAERSRERQGLELLDWKLVMKTKGSLRSGAIYEEELKAKDGQRIDLIGFMVPLNQFKDLTEFILLPVPIECYFCRMPPARDVVFVTMAPGKTVDFVFQEPVMINGVLRLKGEPGTKFFYVIEDAGYGPGKPDEKLTPKHLAPEHMAPMHQQDVQLEQGYEPPAASP
jgi:hypothetical protein